VKSERSYSLLAFQALALLGLVLFCLTAGWQDWVAAFVVHRLMISIGEGIIYHRLLAHKSFDCPRWFLIFGSFWATLAGIGSGVAWTANHGAHHRHADTAQDPHSPWYKRLSWLYVWQGTYPVSARYAAHLLRNPTVTFFHQYYWHIHVAYAIILAVVYPYGLLSMYLAPAHLAWLSGPVMFNYLAHKSGYRNFDTQDQSRNNIWLGLWSFGEGWHNNHHANPGSYTTSYRWWELDINGIIIKLVGKNERTLDRKV
jgi:stearoyl-CoA desaturase (delta-9 desaturase)